MLGLGESVSDTTPNTNFNADFDSNETASEFVTITHQAGDSIETINLNVTVDGTDYTGNLTDDAGIETFSAGDSFTLNRTSNSIDNGDKIQITFSDGDSGSVLRTFEVPQNYSG